MTQTTEKQFTVAVDGELVGEYTSRKSARRRMSKEQIKNPEAKVVFTDRAELERQVKEAIEVEESMDAELAGKEDGFGNELPAEKPESRKAAKKTAEIAGGNFAAKQALKNGKLTEALYQDVINGTLTLDAAIAVAKDLPKAEKPKKVRKASGNGENRRKAAPKKEKAAPKPRNLWSILVMDESGENVEKAVVDEQPFSAFEGGGTGFDALKKDAIAEYPQRVIKTVNVTSGKEYVRRPRKVKKDSK